MYDQDEQVYDRYASTLIASRNNYEGVCNATRPVGGRASRHHVSTCTCTIAKSSQISGSRLACFNASANGGQALSSVLHRCVPLSGDCSTADAAVETSMRA
jgi:hypothetical protein